MDKYDVSLVRLAAARMKTMPHMEAISVIDGYGGVDLDSSLSPAGALPFRAAVFNMECGTRLEGIIPFLQTKLADVDVLLVNEADWGMARTGNRHVTRVLAEALRMNYAFSTEFINMKAGQDGNGAGLHGNAVLCRFPIARAMRVQLPIMHDWFYNKNDPRLGNRCAVLAEAVAGDRRIGLVSVHLENRTPAEGRVRQMEALLSEIDDFFGPIPVLIGGDMNTNAVNGSIDELNFNEPEQARRWGEVGRWEPMMGFMERAGYSWRDCNVAAKPTRRRHSKGVPDVQLNLDWLFARSLECSEPAFYDTTLPEGELSDHNAVAATFTLKP